MLAVTYSSRLLGFYALRNRKLNAHAAAMMEAAPGCVLIAVIAPHFVSDKPHELIALVVAIFAAARTNMLITVILAVATSALFHYLLH